MTRKAILCLALVFSPAVAASEAQQPTDARLDKPVTLTAREAVFPDVLGQVGKQTGLKLEAKPYLQDTWVTVCVKETPARRVLDALCSLNGWSYAKRDDAYVVAAVVVPPAEKGQDLAVRLFGAAPAALRPYLANPGWCRGFVHASAAALERALERDERYRRGEEIPYASLPEDVRRLHVHMQLWEALHSLATLTTDPVGGCLKWTADCKLLFTEADRMGERKTVLHVLGPDGSHVWWDVRSIK